MAESASMNKHEMLAPAHLYAQARRYDVDLAAEPFLIPLMKQAAVTPLPPNWTLLAANEDGQDADGDHDPQDREAATVAYKNELTGLVQSRHPADSYFGQQIRDQRAQSEQLETSGLDQQRLASFSLDAANGWMEFEEPHSTAADADADADADAPATAKYYYDFVTTTRQETHPLVRLRDSASNGGSPSVADPQIFANAVSLHKQPAMKNLEQLEILCFHAWWTELPLQGATRKSFVHIYFSIPTRHFQVVLEDSDNVFTISHVVGPTGRLLTAWDLHVGARISLLGRLTTLMQTSLLTRQWLVVHEARFQNIKCELQTELAKYELKSHGRPHQAGRIECADPHKSQAGVSLRGLLIDITRLKRTLAGYRPDLVRRICADMLDLDE